MLVQGEATHHCQITIRKEGLSGAELQKNFSHFIDNAVKHFQGKVGLTISNEVCANEAGQTPIADRKSFGPVVTEFIAPQSLAWFYAK